MEEDTGWQNTLHKSGFGLYCIAFNTTLQILKGELRMKLNPIRDKNALALVRPLYERAFPMSEKKPFGLIERKVKKGNMEVLEICNSDDTYAGFFITVLGKDVILLDYFAICEECRGKGIGTDALKLLSEHYGGKRIVIEIEDPDIPSKNAEERTRRKGFYLRNGFNLSDDKIILFGVEMLLLCLNGQIAFDEYKKIYTDVFGRLLGRNIKKRA